MNIINIFLPFCRIIESILKKEPLLNLQLYIRQFSSLLSSLTVVANDAFEKIGGGDYFLKIFHHPLPVTVFNRSTYYYRGHHLHNSVATTALLIGLENTSSLHCFYIHL